MQRREAEIGLRDRKRHRRPKERNDTGENTPRNGLSGVDAGICGFVGLDGGRTRARTWDPMIKSHRDPTCCGRPGVVIVKLRAVSFLLVSLNNLNFLRFGPVPIEQVSHRAYFATL
jgi:hypothetical protein